MHTRRSYAALSRADLAVLVPELLLCGQLIDRSGMAHLISAFGREGMAAVAIEEWQASSPWYTKRMQRALNFEGDDVVTIFKGMQLDIGAPPQFMDFRYSVTDRDHGEFRLDHCGALMDVEPLGDAYVTAMCHDIEDPTFDATALATNPHVRVRPVHRPPRAPADRHPHCAWTVTIDPSFEPPPVEPHTERLGHTEAVAVELSPIDRDDDGASDYSGPLLDDLRFADFSRSALVRIAEEVALQHHMLTLGFLMGVRKRTDETSALDLARKQLTGIAGLTSERIRDVLGLPRSFEALATVLDVHPIFAPVHYVDRTVTHDEHSLRLHLAKRGGAYVDGAWPTLLGSEHPGALDALVRGVDPHFSATVVADTDTELVVDVTKEAVAAKECDEVLITRYSSGSSFVFEDRGVPLPLTVL